MSARRCIVCRESARYGRVCDACREPKRDDRKSWHPKLDEPAYVGPFVEWVLEREKLYGNEVNPRQRVAEDVGWPGEAGVRRIYRHCSGEQIWAERPDLRDALANAGVFHLYLATDEEQRDAHCPKCHETVTVGPDGLCPWCETDTKAPIVGKKRGKPAGKYGKLTDDQLRALHLIYEREQLSANELAKRVYERVGYASWQTCANSICNGWRRLGLPRRDRIEATVMASTKHGRAPRYGSRAGYKRWLREQRGDLQPRCEGVKTQAPGKGQPCPQPAMKGSRFCVSHDPERQLKNQAHLARARRKLARGDTLPMAPFSTWLHSLANDHGSVGRAALALGLSRDAAYRYSKGEATSGEAKTEISRTTVERWAAKAGTTVDAIYGTNLELAA